MKINRKLTQGEVALSQSIFGNSIDYDRVKIKNYPLHIWQPKNVSMAPVGHIYCYKTYKNDFSKASLSSQAHFLHEMTHVWQYQNKVKHPVLSAAKDMVKYKFNYNAAYAYTPSEKKDLTTYNLEQQACIIQDYFLMKRGVHPQRVKNYMVGPEAFQKTQKDLSKMLRHFLNNPEYAKRKSWFARSNAPKCSNNHSNRG